jgi:hypothetical protein
MPTDAFTPSHPQSDGAPHAARHDGLPDALRTALRAAHPTLAQAALVPLPDAGLAHRHLRLQGTPWLARVPKQSQMGLAPAQNLAYQRACFEQAAPSGHTPRLLDVLAPAPGLPLGALLVEAIDGRAARLPQDLAAIAQALAALHRLPVPGPIAPLRDVPDPLADLAAEIGAQAVHLDAAGLCAAARAGIAAELTHLQRALQRPDRPPRTLTAFDAHPGNFLVRADGRAVLVDLEKLRRAAPGLDLAHATLYTSTTWERGHACVLDTAQQLRFYRAWEDAMGPAAVAHRPWHAGLRRAMWLWSVTWCAKWRVLSPRAPAVSGEDWSTAHSEDALIAHVRERVGHYLDASTIDRAREGFDAFERALSA